MIQQLKQLEMAARLARASLERINRKEASDDQDKVREIQRVVAEAYGIDPMMIIHPNRPEKAVIPRHAAMWLASQLVGLSSTKLAPLFNRRNHVTILHGIKMTQNRIETSPTHGEKIRALLVQLEYLKNDRTTISPTTGSEHNDA